MSQNNLTSSIIRPQQSVDFDWRVILPYYEEDGITIYNADCRTAMRALRLNVDYTITSPPYNVGNNNMTAGKYLEKQHDTMSDNDYYNFLEVALHLMLENTKYYVFFNIQMLSASRIVILELLYKFRNEYKDKIIWSKTQVAPQIEPGVMNNAFEDVYIFTKLDAHKRKFDRCNFNQGTFKNIIEGNNASSNEWAKLHKATFPEYLPATIINNFTFEGDTILDPFMGTGTTLAVARKLRRKAVGIELRREYCDIAIKRLSQMEIF